MTFKDLVKGDFEKYKNLGMCVYAVDFEGIVHFLNQNALEFFDDSGQFNVQDYYADSKQREPILKLFDSAEDRDWVCNENAHFNIKGHTKILKYFAQIYKDKHGKLLGSLCIGFKIHHFEAFKNLEDNLSIGFFEINSEKKIIYACENFKKIIGYTGDSIPQPEEIISSIELEKMQNKFMKGNSKKFSPVRLDLDDNVKLIEIVLDPITHEDEEGETTIIGARGLIKDITEEQIFKDTPIGLYMLNNSGETKKIVWHNDSFKEIHQKIVPGRENFYGYEVNQFYESEDGHKELESKLDNLGGKVSDYKANLKKGVSVLVNAKNLIELNLRVGSTTDISDSVDDWIKETRDHFGGFLHTYSSCLGMVSSNLLDVARSLDKESIITISKDYKRIEFNLQKAQTELKNKLNEFKGNLKKVLRDSNISIKEKLEKQLNKLEEHDKYLPKSIAAWTRLNAINIEKSIDAIPNDEINKETRKELSRSLNSLINISNVVAIQSSYAEIQSLWEELNLLKEYLITNKFQFQNKHRLNVKSVLLAAINSLTEYSVSENINIRYILDKSCDDAIVYFHSYHLKIAFFNVIHNAIKYSYSKNSLDNPFIRIKMKLSNEGDHVIISVENRGVQIFDDELDRIKKWGTRGKLSSDRGRPGTGIGLFHVASVINEIEGKLDIESIPFEHYHDHYDGPCINTVTMTIPIKRNK